MPSHNKWRLPHLFSFVGLFIVTILLVIQSPKNTAQQQSLFLPKNNDLYDQVSSSSPYTIIEYFDLHCEHCKKLHDLKKENRIEGLNFIVRNFPLVEDGSSAQKALLSECLHRTSGASAALSFIDKSYLLFDKREDDALFVNEAHSRAKNVKEFDACVNDESVKNFIEQEKGYGYVSGITMVPSLVVLKNNSVVKVYNGVSSKYGMFILNYYKDLYLKEQAEVTQ